MEILLVKALCEEDFGLILATYKAKVDKLKLVEVANQLCFENEHHLSI